MPNKIFRKNFNNKRLNHTNNHRQINIKMENELLKEYQLVLILIQNSQD